MVFRKLTVDDMKDKLTMKGSLFDILAATAARAKELSKNLEAITQTRPPSKRRKERPAAARVSDGGGGESSSSAASKKRKYNSPNRRDNMQQQLPQPPPPLPEEFKNAIEEMARGRNVAAAPATLVIQKRLYNTDLSSGHNRLSIPLNQISDDFLTEEEKRYLRGSDENDKRNYKEVRIFEPSLAAETVKFSWWDMAKGNGRKTSSIYVINGKWNDIVQRNELRVGMVVQLWCFRVEQDLCFALVRLPSYDQTD